MSAGSEMPHDAASRRQLVKAGGIALAAAAVILVVAVLPAEYAIDPTGLGRALGLTQMSAPPEETVFVPPEGASNYQPIAAGASFIYGAPFNSDAVEFTIDGYDYMEFKYHLVQGAPMMFSWTASAPVNHDFHGEPDADPKNGVQSFDTSARREANGSLVAPFTGVHGWFWENTGPEPVTVRIESAGYYSSAVVIASNRTRTVHDLAGRSALPMKN